MLPDGAKAVDWARRDLALRENSSTQAALAWALLRNGQATAEPIFTRQPTVGPMLTGPYT